MLCKNAVQIYNFIFTWTCKEVKIVLPGFVFSMKSLMIRKSETSLFLQRDQRSMYAKALKISGEGQGLFIAQKMLQLNDGFLKIETDDKPIKKQGRLYTNNTFRLYFREAID
jgi:hypothetical protein